MKERRHGRHRERVVRAAVFCVIATTMASCHSGRPERPSPEAKRAMDSAMTAVRDSGGPDSTASDTTTP